MRNRTFSKKLLTLILALAMLVPGISVFAETIVEEDMVEENITDEGEEDNEEINMENEIDEEDNDQEIEDEENEKEEYEDLEDILNYEENNIEVKSFNTDNFKNSNVNYVEFHMGYKNVDISEVTKEVKPGQTLRVVVYNPEAEVSLGDIEINGVLELVSYEENKSIQKLVNTYPNVTFKNFVEITKTINGKESLTGRSEDIVDINIKVELNEYIGGSTYCHRPPGKEPEGLPEENDDYKHDGYRDINIYLEEYNDLELEEISDIKIEGLPKENYSINQEDDEIILSLSIPRELENINIIDINYSGKLPEVEEEEEYITQTGVNIDNEDIRVALPEEQVLARHLTEYRVNYITTDGRLLTEPEVFIGEIGTEVNVAVNNRIRTKDYRYLRNAYNISHNDHQYRHYGYKASLILDEDAKNNSITFVYAPDRRYGHLIPSRNEVIGINNEYTVYHVDRESNMNIIEPIKYVRKTGIHHNSLTNKRLDDDILEDINYKYSGHATRKRSDRNYRFTNLSTVNRRYGEYFNNHTNILYDLVYYYDSVAPRPPIEPDAVDEVMDDHLTNYTIHYEDEIGDKIKSSDRLIADKGAFVRSRVDHSLGRFYWYPVSQYRANQNAEDITPLSPYKYQDIRGVDNQELTFRFRGHRNAEYIDDVNTKRIYGKHKVRHRDIDTKRDIVEPIEYKQMGKSYMSNKAFSKKNQSKIGYKLVDLKRVDHAGRERSIKSCGKVPTEYRNNLNYDLIFDYKYIGGSEPETEGPGWINPNITEEIIKSNKVNIKILPKKPQEVTVRIKDIKTENIFKESTFDQVDGKDLNSGDIITIGEEFKLDGISIKDLLDKEGHSIITALPFEFEIVESESLEDGEIGNEIDIYYMPSTDGYINYTIRHVYEDDKGRLVDIVDRRVGQDDLEDRIVAKPEVFENFEYIEEEDSKYIDLVEDPNKNVIIFKYERVKDGKEIDNYEGNSSYILNHRYVDSEDLIKEEIYENAVTGVKILKKLEHIGPEQYVLERQPFEIEVIKNRKIVKNIYYSNKIGHRRRSNYLIRSIIETENGLVKDIKDPKVLKARVLENIFIDWYYAGLLVIEDDGRYYKLNNEHKNDFIIIGKEDLNILSLKYHEISKEEAEEILNRKWKKDMDDKDDNKDILKDSVKTIEEREEDLEVIDGEEIIEEVEKID